MTRAVEVVIVAYRAADELDRCLSTLGTRFATTVVDNSNSPAVKTVAVRRSAAYMDASRNMGFGAGANLALRPLLQGQPRDVLLLNPDTSLAPSEVDKLAKHLHRTGNERLAAVSPRLVDRNGVGQQVGKGRLRSLDLRRQQRLLAHIHKEKERWRR